MASDMMYCIRFPNIRFYYKKISRAFKKFLISNTFTLCDHVPFYFIIPVSVDAFLFITRVLLDFLPLEKFQLTER